MPAGHGDAASLGAELSNKLACQRGSSAAAAERAPALPRRTAAMMPQLPGQQPAVGSSSGGARGHDRKGQRSLEREAAPLEASASGISAGRLAGKAVSGTPQAGVRQPAATQQLQEEARAVPVQPSLSLPAVAGQPARASLPRGDMPLRAAAATACAAQDMPPALHAPESASSAAGKHPSAHAGQAAEQEAYYQADQSGTAVEVDATGESVRAASPLLLPGADLHRAAIAEPDGAGLARKGSAAHDDDQSRAAATLQPPASLPEAALGQHSAGAAPLTDGQAAASVTPVVSEALRGEGISAGITIRSRRPRGGRSSGTLGAAAAAADMGSPVPAGGSTSSLLLIGPKERHVAAELHAHQVRTM